MVAWRPRWPCSPAIAAEISLAAQLLVYPMLDDRTVATGWTIPAMRLWNQSSNRFGWSAYLGDGTPSRGARTPADLSGLPPAWVGVGTLDLFHDEDLAYAERLKAAGVPCEIEVVAGAFHGFDGIVPKAQVSRSFFNSQCAMLRRHSAPACGLELRLVEDHLAADDGGRDQARVERLQDFCGRRRQDAQVAWLAGLDGAGHDGLVGPAEEHRQSVSGRDALVGAEHGAAAGRAPDRSAHRLPRVVIAEGHVGGQRDRHGGPQQRGHPPQFVMFRGGDVLEILVTALGDEVGLGHHGHSEFDKLRHIVVGHDSRVFDAVLRVSGPPTAARTR